MQSYKPSFIEFMLRNGVLQFGDFVTKSGRSTPYFINTGRYRTGTQMRMLARFYADAIETRGVEFDFLFGPAYKGIPLVVAIAMELSERGRDVPFCFNRKEVKDHGEGGWLVGHQPSAGERALLVEDVTTAGTSIRETVPRLQAVAPLQLAGLIVSVDRMERGRGHASAFEELRAEFGFDAFAIVTIDEVVEHLCVTPVDGQLVIDGASLERIRRYRETYGPRPQAGA